MEPGLPALQSCVSSLPTELRSRPLQLADRAIDGLLTSCRGFSTNPSSENLSQDYDSSATDFQSEEQSQTNIFQVADQSQTGALASTDSTENLSQESSQSATDFQSQDPPQNNNDDAPISQVADQSQTGAPSESCWDWPVNRLLEFMSSVYDMVVHWRPNIFAVPYGREGAEFVRVIAGLVSKFVANPECRPYVWFVVAVSGHLLLQKPFKDSKASDNIRCLGNRLRLWNNGEVETLVEEGLCLQQHLRHRRFPNNSGAASGPSDIIFSKLVFSGKIHSAMRYLSQESGGVLTLDECPIPDSGETVKDILFEKHPLPVPASEDSLLASEEPAINPVIYEAITADRIKNTSRRMHGSAGPSGLDADDWTKMMTCFKESSNQLCSALASMARCLCTEDLVSKDLAAFTAARLIPLDKKPGVRPIAVGEVFRRIICKAIMAAVEYDVTHAIAPYQMCVGVPSACEAAVHTMDLLLRRPEVEGILLVDATNAFNSLNRAAALHNIPRVCPALGRIFRNTYQEPVRLFVTGSPGEEVLSQEGTCQGDPLAMASYAVAITPLIRHLNQECPDVTQSWYADDDGAAANMEDLHRYWEELERCGPQYGYHPNASKTVLLTKPQHLANAQHLFASTGIEIRTDGCQYLGGAIGVNTFCEAFISAQAVKWREDLSTLADLAQTQPHAAYATFTKGLVSRWRYHIRATACPPATFERLDEVINQELLPALLGKSIPEVSPTRCLLSLPARLGGIAVPVVGKIAAGEHEASRKITAPLVRMLVRDIPEVPPDLGISDSTSEPLLASNQDASHSTQPLPEDPLTEALSATRQLAWERRRECWEEQHNLVLSLLPQVSPGQKLILNVAAEKGVSSWLTATPKVMFNTVLNKSDFRDALCLRYDLPLDSIPTSCVCGSPLTTHHAMTCPSGGYPTARHNEVRDVLAEALKDAVQEIRVEPPLLPMTGEDLPGRTVNRASEARLDIAATGFWTRQQPAFFDIRVTHPKAGITSRKEAQNQLAAHEAAKKRAYSARVANVDRGAFTPLVFNTLGMPGRECSVFLKELANQICDRNIDLSYSVVMSRLRCKLSFCLLRWNITCLRGCRASYGRRRIHPFASECRLTQ